MAIKIDTTVKTFKQQVSNFLERCFIIFDFLIPEITLATVQLLWQARCLLFKIQTNE